MSTDITENELAALMKKRVSLEHASLAECLEWLHDTLKFLDSDLVAARESLVMSAKLLTAALRRGSNHADALIAIAALEPLATNKAPAMARDGLHNGFAYGHCKA